MNPNQLLSPHFTLEELTRSEKAAELKISNVPGDEEISNLSLLSLTLLEPIRELLGKPLVIHSGLRSTALNRAVGGVKTSAHLDGRAADFHPEGWNLQKAWTRIKDSNLPYDQLIVEHAEGGPTWLHVAMAPEGQTPRYEAFPLTTNPGRTAIS